LRYRFHLSSSTLSLSDKALSILKSMLHDRMTEEEYVKPITSFDVHIDTKKVTTIPIMEEGRAALEKINAEMGLGFDNFDLDYYTRLFKEKLQRNPTDVECFDMGQSNSEHSRHWFFGGKMVIDGVEKPSTLFQMVKATLSETSKANSIIAFHDNSSSIRGYDCLALKPNSVGTASSMSVQKQTLHPILTAETHNFPSGVAPFPGAETGTGGRLRDVMATGRGAYPVAGISSYCVGNLQIPDYDLPWEDKSFVYPSNLATPLSIQIEASNGASDYGNKFGEPVIHGFSRSFGQRLPNGERFEWVKPIMFSAGVGQLDGLHTTKGAPEKGMLVVKVGGPAYRIGIGGGAASSRVQSSEHAELDFDAVQRGDAEMENRLCRLMKACCDLGDKNPIISVHDQGAGGNGNVLKEIVEPAGAEYDIRKVLVGDKTMSVLEIWGAEYQENNALLIKPEDQELFESIARRENCPIRILGAVTGDGKVVVKDSEDGSTPVDLPLELVLGKMPQKTFVDNSIKLELQPLSLPENTTVMNVVDRVLRLISVGSKRFLVHKVDRSVTGLIAQQQCVGPLQLPLANVGVVAHTHFSITGTAVACGEQPIKGLINSAAMARMTVAEAMTNLVWAKISSIKDIKASGNWMYAAKLPGEGAKMYDACEALRDSLLELEAAIDGGKDSLSMAAQCGDEIVKAPGELTLTCYVTCPDITKTVTPDLKCPNGSSTKLCFIDLGNGKARVGGSSLTQVYNQIGDESPDIEDFSLLKKAFEVTQTLIDDRLILAGHDRSDGGLAVTLMEMAFAGNCSISVDIPDTSGCGDIATLFNEEAGFVIEVSADNCESVIDSYKKSGVPCVEIGTASPGDSIKVSVGSASPCIDEKTTVLRDVWEATGFQLEKRQRNPECVAQEEAGLKLRKSPEWNLTFKPEATSENIMQSETKHKVAILRQEGSNGDKEMISAFVSAGFDAWDVSVSDLLSGSVTLDSFRGLVFVGGFSYADVLDSGKGWAGVIKFNKHVYDQFQSFRNRSDTFSLGVCNGCQLMALLGWIPTNEGLTEDEQPRLLHNHSGKFESRFSSVTIKESPSVLLKGMEGSSLGVWVAHGEGRFYFPKQSIHEEVMAKSLAPIRYVNDSNEVTQEYPFNPNGSPDGIAALCSQDGRHLAMMPHPERVFTSWQWPWVPDTWKDLTVGPWLKMFQNARDFCDQ
jgi:phosphoribosylformylglycinamidine synthase